MLSNEPSPVPRSDKTQHPIGLPGLEDLRDKILSLQSQNHSESQLEALVKRIAAVATAKHGHLRIGMYDGSFDPPHYGHIETARAAVPAGRLDLIVMNCHPKPNAMKPNLSPHPLRTEMLRSYFPGDPVTIVSPLSRGEIDQILAPHRIVGIIGSDTFQRFLQEGIAPDFRTDEIVVSERHSAPLITAPTRLEERPVWYIGRNKLAYNNDCSTSIRSALAPSRDDRVHPMLNSETHRIARAHRLYTKPHHVGAATSASSPVKRETPTYTVPESYRECAIEPQVGLENGLLSESFVFQVRDPSEETVAFMKMLPPERDALNHLRDEAYGLALFNKLGLRTASAPQALLCAQPPSLWIERAPGETPGNLITKYERGLGTAQDVYDALYAVGAFLKELHTRHSQPFDDKSAELLETYIAHHQGLLDRAPRVDLQSQMIERAIKAFHHEAPYFRERGLRCSLIHGDASCTNFLWDTQTKRLSVIDMQRLGTQARTGAPAFSMYEFRAFFSTLNYYPNIGFKGVRGGLSDAYAAYQAGYGPVDRREDRFFRILHFIRKELGGPERVHEITRPSLKLKKVAE
jgi:cytidyltransferase-like protein